MMGKRTIQATSLVILGSITVGGFLLGAFAWFGGYLWIHQLVTGLAFALGLAITTLRWRSAPRNWLKHIGFFAVSQFLFFLSVAAGQVCYVGASNPMDAARLFGIAMQGGL